MAVRGSLVRRIDMEFGAEFAYVLAIGATVLVLVIIIVASA
jgi:hypothetical protein